MHLILNWLRINFYHQEGLVLLGLILGINGCFLFLSDITIPLFISLTIAYVLHVPTLFLKRWMPYQAALYVTFTVFVIFLYLLFAFGIPNLCSQVYFFMNSLPSLMSKAQDLFGFFLEDWSRVFPDVQLHKLTNVFQGQVDSGSRVLLEFSLNSIFNTGYLFGVFFVVVFTSFFLLKDSNILSLWALNWLPSHRPSLDKIGSQIIRELGLYIKVKVLQLILVTVICSILFSIKQLNYPILFSFLMGCGMLVPYVGPASVFIPFFLVAYAQVGWSAALVELISWFMGIVAINGYMLEPWLFSTRLALHPVPVLLSVWILGVKFGVWGAFFGIPVLIVIKALVQDWPKAQ